MPLHLELSRSAVPIEVEWSLTWDCNAACFFCSTARFKRKPLPDAAAILRNIIECNPVSVTLSGGEPLVHPRVNEIAKELIARRIAVSLTTNGVRLRSPILDPEVIRALNWARVSLHTTSQRVADRVFGSGFELGLVLQNIRDYLRVNPRLSVFYLLTVYNSRPEDLVAFIDDVAELGVPTVVVGVVKQLGAARPDHAPAVSDVLRSLDVLRERARHHDLELQLPNVEMERHPCQAGRYSMSIWPDGSLRVCSFEAWTPVGNALADDLLQTWNDRIDPVGYCNKCRPGGYTKDTHDDTDKRRLRVVH